MKRKSRTKMDSRNFCRRKNVSGHFPGYGAIFMSNRSTLKECFEKSLLGLPDSHSGFVRKVKEGMILFLFEFEERKLYGVFKAISDGGMNIVPHAYISSGKQFPAQVKFTTIWHCDPLFEDEFCDAIENNYFSNYKFNFGLSKDQVQRLMWLFNSRQHEVPHSLHYNKRKEREWDFQSTGGGQMKERLTNIDISEMKLNMNHGISVTAEPEMDRLSLSPDSCKKCESIHFDDDAYDPEHPGFLHSVETAAESAVVHESCGLLTLQQKKGKIHLSAEETEDYIPLCSPDDSDSEEEEIDLSECLGIFVGNRVSSIPIPQFPPSNGYNRMKMDPPFASSHGSPCCRLDDSSSAAHHLSDASDSQSKDGIDNSKSLPSKGLYSDNTKTRTSVFSRLNFSSSKGVASKKQNDGSGKELVNDMSRAKLQSQYESQKMEKVTQQKHGIGDYSTVCRRTSVFMRLTGASGAVTSQVHCMTELTEGTGEWKKGQE